MSSCKFKSLNNALLCQITQGYCQYQENGYEDGSICPIKANYCNYDNYWLSANIDKDGKVKVENIKASDDDPTTVDTETKNLDIKI